jgi:hypothetical protein
LLAGVQHMVTGELIQRGPDPAVRHAQHTRFARQQAHGAAVAELPATGQTGAHADQGLLRFRAGLRIHGRLLLGDGSDLDGGISALNDRCRGLFSPMNSGDTIDS